MGALQICILNKLLVVFGTNEFDYKELKLYLLKVHRIPKLFVNDVIADFIINKKIIKTKTATYKLKEGLQEEIIDELEKIHSIKTKVFID